MLEGLESWSDAMGIHLPEGAGEGMRSFWRLVLETNKHTNLTRITDDRDAVFKHFIDSLTVLQTGLVAPDSRVVDVGTGAGFPGIPLKIARPNLRLTLIDSTLKRVRFLQEVVKAMGWRDVEAVHGRAERLGRDKPWTGRFDVAVARAVARLDRLGPLCLPFVRPGGYFIAMKGPDMDEELRQGEAALKNAGGRVVDVVELQLPEGMGRRTLVVVAKQGRRAAGQESAGKLQKKKQIAEEKTGR